MLNSLTNSLPNNGLFHEPKECFHLVLDYPSIERDPLFHQVSELLHLVGSSMGEIIGDFLTMTQYDRMDPRVLEYTLVESITQAAQALSDSIETIWNPVEGTFKTVDPDDQYTYVNSTEAVFGDDRSPLSAWSLTAKLIPMMQQYYGHIYLPEDMEIHADWDYDLTVFGEMAIIQFKSSENQNILKNLLVL